MWTEDLLEPASVQYGDWSGTVAGDNVDMRSINEILGVDRDKYRILAVDVSIYGGRQHLVAYGVPSDQGWGVLQAIADRGEPIRCRVVADIEAGPEGHFDTNPPAPPSAPVTTPTDLFAYAFKRLQIRILTRSLPPGSQLLVEHLEDGDEGFEYDNDN